MISETKRIFIILALLFLGGYIAIGTIFYYYTYDYALDQNKKKLDQILLNQRALHSYVEGELKPVIYQLKEEGKLYKDFFNPKILSFTYIARNIHKNFNALEAQQQTNQIHYKLATDNPRNALNQANAEEIEILHRFRHNPQIKEYSKTLFENGVNYIYYAMPVAPSQASCMRCHSTPEKAPAEMIQQYGDKAGFGEKEGDIRAMISLKMPFDDELSEANSIFMLIMLLWTFFLVVLYSVIVYFILQLNKNKHIIEEKNKALASLSELDSLTSIFNRRSFDRDLANYISDPSLVLIILDIDYFKVINDTYGHQVGDTILQKLSALLRSLLRESDTLYRIGGEEFAILMRGYNKEDIKRIVQRLILTVGEYNFDIKQQVHISAGVSIRTESDTPILLFKRTDEALYTAKASGRNQYIIS